MPKDEMLTRDEILSQCEELARIIFEPLRPEMERAAARGNMDRVAELDREGKCAYAMATEPLKKMLALLPPEPIIIPKGEQPK